MKDYDENKESYLKYWDVNNLYGWAMSQKFPVNKFQRIEDTSQFNEDFIKSYNQESDARYFFEVDVQYPKKLHELHNDLPFLPERRNEKCRCECKRSHVHEKDYVGILLHVIVKMKNI